jgi:glutamine amidotransferase
MMGILKYGAAGNIGSLCNAIRRCGVEPKVVGRVELEQEGDSLDGLIIPGVGSFSTVAKIQEALGGKLENMTCPVLGICLGMQALLEKSEESVQTPGLGVVQGQVVKLQAPGLRLPQLGWNQVTQKRTDPLWEGIGDGAYFYFANSYGPVLEKEEDEIGQTTYGTPFASALRKDNWWGVQFHPEKSGKDGLRLLRNFIQICQER